MGSERASFIARPNMVLDLPIKQTPATLTLSLQASRTSPNNWVSSYRPVDDTMGGYSLSITAAPRTSAFSNTSFNFCFMLLTTHSEREMKEGCVVAGTFCIGRNPRRSLDWCSAGSPAGRRTLVVRTRFCRSVRAHVANRYREG